MPSELMTEIGAKDFLTKQKELIESYRQSSDKDNWADQMLDSKEKRDAFEQIVEERTKSALNDF